MIRGRSYRRAAARRWQRRRYNNWKSYYYLGTTDDPWLDSTRVWGMFRKTHFGCGCFMCKPWKHKAYSEPKYQISVYRKGQFYVEFETNGSES